jgi:ABC-type multidrug transport system permease subunit
MYNVLAYFCGKITSEVPNFFWAPSLLTLICYFVLGFQHDPISKFFIFLFIRISLYIAGAGMGLLIGSCISNKQVAVSLTPIVIIPFMLFAGFCVNQNNIPIFLKPFQYISLFKYGMQALMIVSFHPNLLE